MHCLLFHDALPLAVYNLSLVISPFTAYRSLITACVLFLLMLARLEAAQAEKFQAGYCSIAVGIDARKLALD